ncbi:bifunctional 4-hydroxy-2-oxoglutarate aldolase/2-dehydro-3-deoxy-phosphogluconate aldolase [Hymenobacter taeanensis]|uniref:Bifunctional 4-hydroxy-2-oxoglutarate aldolase/2-dehydro-3-deoxy-phosphogluconate aldolase n=1 Tax=Hymenobacter taeanensis TaxID=2735321 RepID=A0A6M6BIQ0_9BACT|nr:MULTISPECIES: bifunctional 4-hydroxy-2-oxoglutarate aldolase/2-dehydro-3-deoxy-phosphogluconate aldolase [Hymenobacter]QJX48007.1 bifunctional 4-hydroxy-2-oxoglutarate aldolase/2-dehydro-3-deoxy-phosphogluconate aldolase [Hymenobacter taeanensis]UOQ82544.1 bifunctional 4-hydroxy-2-oxoglutarate aldolase/2-dehydro-3-deoxy-phosphogluconate aldolase [Hymenobacter sp. 5414T-23]
MPRYSAAAIQQIVLDTPIVPVFFHADVAYTQRILQACYEGGLRVFEFTNRGANAFEVFSALMPFVQENCPGMLLGIGTIYTAEDAERFIQAGADFVVQPCLTTEVADVCRTHGTPWLPGTMTVGEVYQATKLGAAIVKIFPGNVVGPGFIKSLRGPMPTVPLMVTGGVEPTEDSLREWFAAGVNVVGMGSQLFKNVDDTQAFSQQIAHLLEFVGTLKK